jgi:hypothetical protein
LPLGQFHQLQNFVQLIQRVPQDFSDFGGMGHCLRDGGGVGGPKIRRPGPRPALGAAVFGLGRPSSGLGAHRFPLGRWRWLRFGHGFRGRCRFAFGLAQRLGFADGFGQAFGQALGGQRRRFVQSRRFHWFVQMWLAKITGAIASGFRQRLMHGRLVDRFRGGFRCWFKTGFHARFHAGFRGRFHDRFGRGG